MSKISRSPDIGTFSIKSISDRGGDSEEVQLLLDMYQERNTERLRLEETTEWQKNNLEYDLRTTDWTLEKVRMSEKYAMHLYAALCNNDFMKNDIMSILVDDYWSCSFRHAASIIANMRQQGDYIDWYCNTDNDISEGVVTDEIRNDIFKLGWIIKSQEYESWT